MRSRYSRWDGTQRLDLDADELLDAMSDDLMADGDPWSALRRMLQRGVQTTDARVPGLRELMDQLRRRRQQQLERYDLDSALDDIRKRLDDVLATERAGIEQRVAEGREMARRGEVSDAALQKFERMVARKREALDRLPEDPGGRIKELQGYEFVDPEAKRKFEDLLNQLRQQMMKPFMPISPKPSGSIGLSPRCGIMPITRMRIPMTIIAPISCNIGQAMPARKARSIWLCRS